MCPSVPTAADATADPPLTISVVICCYTDRRMPVLIEAIEHVSEQLRAGDELLVVVDHSPQLLARIQERFPALKVVENAHRPGLSGARNSAVAHCSCDVVAFLDDDAVPTPTWLEALRQSYREENVIGAGGVVTPRWPEVAPDWMPAAFLWVVGCSYEGLPVTVAPIRNPIGANMSFRREVFARVGGFSESLGRVGTLPVGCEETEFSIRVGTEFAGHVIVHQPAAEVIHHIGDERTALRYFVHRCWSEGLSKAAVARLASSSAALSSERSYVTRTVLPGVVRQLAAAIRGERSALARAAALVLGTGVTAISYLLHSLRGDLSTPAGAGAPADS